MTNSAEITNQIYLLTFGFPSIGFLLSFIDAETIYFNIKSNLFCLLAIELRTLRT